MGVTCRRRMLVMGLMILALLGADLSLGTGRVRAQQAGTTPSNGSLSSGNPAMTAQGPGLGSPAPLTGPSLGGSGEAEQLPPSLRRYLPRPDGQPSAAEPRREGQDGRERRDGREVRPESAEAPAGKAVPIQATVKSAIEQSFEGSKSGIGVDLPPLQQFGYSVFSSSRMSTFAPVDDVPVGPDYVLGPGDDLSINVWGQVDSTMVRTVDRNGRIFLPKVGDLRVWGLTFGQADQLIREQLSRYFRGFQTSVSMGRLRTIKVYVVGEVAQPGAFTLSALATLTNGLTAAGGPTKLGSLRQIWLFRNHHVVGQLDLYDFLLQGDRSRDFRLESGDTIFVPTIGDTVAVGGEVKRPAIYEIGKDIRVSDVVETAGGITPRAYLRRIQLVRSQPNAERRIIDLDLSNYYVKGDARENLRIENGDIVMVYPSDPNVYNTVRVAGAVRYPGTYELKPLMRIGQLLTRENILPYAHAQRVEVVRRRPDLSLEVVAVDMTKVWGGDQAEDVRLNPLDEITVRTELRDLRRVDLKGQVVRPGRYVIAPGEHLSSLLARAGGFTDKAFLPGAVFTRETTKTVEQQRLDEFVKYQEQRLLASAGTTVVGLDKEDAALSAQTIQARRDLLKALASRVAVGRVVVRLDQPERLRGTSQDVILQDGDTLEVPEPPSSVLVLGAVRNPTSVLFEPGMNAEYYVNRVGGLTAEAAKGDIHIVKADGSAMSGFPKLRTLEPGDAIIVPPKEEQKYRVLPTVRDVLQVLGSSLISLAALAVLF